MNNPFQTTVPAPGTAGTIEAPAFGAGPGVQMAPATQGAYIPGGTVSPTLPGAPATTAPTYAPPTYTPPQAPAVPSVPNTPANQYYPPGNSFDMRQSSVTDPGQTGDLAGGPMPETAPLDRLEPTGAEYNPRRRRRTSPPLRKSAPSSESLATRSTESSPATQNDPEPSVDRIAFPDSDTAASANSRGTELRIVSTAGSSRDAWHGEDAPEEKSLARNRPSEPSAMEPVGEVSRAYQVARHDESADLGVIRASFNQPQSTSVEQSVPTESGFHHDAKYQALAGRLEYLQSSRQWKLRYIPIDGDTDQYGGSVILAESQLLDGYRPGEYVTLSGSLTENVGSGKGYAPRYEVEQIHRQKG